MMNKEDTTFTRPPDPPDLEEIRSAVKDIIGDLDLRIQLEVEEQLKGLKKVLKEKEAIIETNERRIAQLEVDVKLLAEKHPSFSRISEIKTRNEARTTTKTTFEAPFPSVAETAAVFLGAASSSRTAPNPPTRRPSVSRRTPQQQQQ